ncbi:MAG: DUF5667 domain-containing protein [Candidatus Pacebacteria bacterium]|jgi:uncharacterized protein YjbJ (UPF0337 family)|nr:DUF5667 domain-containing protein [Candidatus Paceibacterota bacterium]MDD2796451.1 DUF5667 domain-containing protein [Candidatus Paceibacterota bacterium]MDD3047837.1 DUF5667 domain-containing protein [Candidatus Paceibacterota bacterium]MDD3509677.1 DUF5667 domain-containing protein [Candidatus Paceibacterota bacterium]MDD3918697.1 DUF5667 domain-containing protein [Candidatus Paceibacterota bacterium]
MLKKLTIISILTLVFFSFNFASAGGEIKILPNNPLYVFKDLGRKIQDFFTFDTGKKIKLRLNVAEEKLQEIEQMVKDNPNNSNYDKYLKKYEDSVKQVQGKVNELPGEIKDKLLDVLASKMIGHESRLENLKYSMQDTAKDTLDKIKDTVFDKYTEISLKMTSEENFINKIKDQFQSITDDSILRIQNEASGNFKKIVDKVLGSDDQNEELLNKVNRDVEEMGLTMDDILETISLFTEEDMASLEQFARDILSGKKSEKDTDQVDLSADAFLKIEALAEIAILNNAIRYCEEEGFEVEDKKYCVSKEGEKCDVLDFFSQICSF